MARAAYRPGMQSDAGAELRLLKQGLLEMGELAGTALEVAIEALVQRDGTGLTSVSAIGPAMRAAEAAIERGIPALIAQRPPIAANLHFLLVVTGIAADVNRVYDQALNVARCSAHLIEEEPAPLPGLTPAIADVCLSLLRDALEAFVRGDVVLARRVVAERDAIDRPRVAFAALIDQMLEDPATVTRAVSLNLIARNLDRVAGHAAEIARRVVSLVEAREPRLDRDEPPRIALEKAS